MMRRPRPGLHGLTHFLTSRLAASGVTVNTLAPALVAETGMLPGDPAQLRRQVPVGGLGQPSKVADLAAAILANAYLTNQVISLDGGIHPGRYRAVSITASGPSWLGVPADDTLRRDPGSVPPPR
jgi:NAD(P)-dependent dehydrogenase (short-subunit alcohol dehydrogenase family)